MANKKRNIFQPISPKRSNKMQAAAEIMTSQFIFFLTSDGARNKPRVQLISRPCPRFSEALARCQPEGDIIGNVCAASGVSPGYLALERMWPWLRKRIPTPCGCRILHPSALLTLCHIYDHHVLDKGEWSMQELVEWTTRTQARLEAEPGGRTRG